MKIKIIVIVMGVLLLTSSCNSKIYLSLSNIKAFPVGNNSQPSDDQDSEDDADQTYDHTSLMPMKYPRNAHGTVTLNDGRVLVAGGALEAGVGRGDVVASVEIYDPQTNLWIDARPMTTARAQFSIGKLDDGKVIVYGGGNPDSGTLDTTEIYDPQTNLWSAGPLMHEPRVMHTMVKLEDGRFLLAAGNGLDEDENEVTLNTTEFYSSTTGAYLSNGPLLNEGRYLHAMSVLGDGRVLISGGIKPEGDGGLAPVELYDPKENNGWVLGPEMNVVRTYHNMITLNDGRAMAIGGFSQEGGPDGGPELTAEIFDPTTNQWSTPFAINTEKVFGGVELLKNGQVITTGGVSFATFEVLSRIEIYTPSSQLWISSSLPSLAPMGTSRFFHTMSALSDSKAIVVGGVTGSVYGGLFLESSVELYDANANTWTSLAPLSSNRVYHGMSFLSGDRVLVTGGTDSLAGGSPLNTSEIYTLTTNSWAPAAPMSTARQFHAMTTLKDGRILVSGGEGAGASYLSSVEIYNPTNNTWSPAAAMNTGRKFHAMVTLEDGRVLVTGGNTTGDLTLDTAEIYNPQNNTWSPFQSMTAARSYHAVAVLGDGKIVVTGGLSLGGELLGSTEIYDPEENTWSPGASAISGSLETQVHEMVTLTNGKILLTVKGITKLYDPITKRWQ